MNEHAVMSVGFIAVGSILIGIESGLLVGVGIFLIAFALLPNLRR